MSRTPARFSVIPTSPTDAITSTASAFRFDVDPVTGNSIITGANRPARPGARDVADAANAAATERDLITQLAVKAEANDTAANVEKMFMAPLSPTSTTDDGLSPFSPTAPSSTTATPAAPTAIVKASVAAVAPAPTVVSSTRPPLKPNPKPADGKSAAGPAAGGRKLTAWEDPASPASPSSASLGVGRFSGNPMGLMPPPNSPTSAATAANTNADPVENQNAGCGCVCS